MAGRTVGRGRPAVGLGCPASAGLAWTTPVGVGAAATAIRLLGIQGDAGLGSRVQPLGVLALRGLDPAVTAIHTTVSSLMSTGLGRTDVWKALACRIFRLRSWRSVRIPNMRYSSRHGHRGRMSLHDLLVRERNCVATDGHLDDGAGRCAVELHGRARR